jgi:N-acetylmuramoyl-L-alanine amidase
MRDLGKQRLRMLAAAAALAAAVSPANAQRTPTSVCNPANFKIAVDAGHTPEAPGATSARGVKEYVFNLRLAGDLETALKGAGFDRTRVMTVHGVGRAQLKTRTTRINAFGADLLLSIHHDDVNDRYKSSWTYNGVAHPYSDRFSGYSLFISRGNPFPDESLGFAKLVGAELQARGLQYTPHHTEKIENEGRELLDTELGIYGYDELFVLKNATMPAMLMEAGIIANRADELALASAAHRALLTGSLLKAIDRTCAALQQAKR